MHSKEEHTFITLMSDMSPAGPARVLFTSSTYMHEETNVNRNICVC